MKLRINKGIRLVPILLGGAMAGVLTGCGNLSGLGGTSEFACKAPEGVRCLSVSGNYYNSVQGNQTSTRGNPPRREQALPSESAARAPIKEVSFSAGGKPSAGFEPMQLRSQSRVRRLWIKPWEDADRDLHDQSFVFLHGDGGRWLLDHVHRTIRDNYAPLSAPLSAAAAPPQVPPPASPATNVERPAGSDETVDNTGGGAARAATDVPRRGEVNEQ